MKHSFLAVALATFIGAAAAAPAQAFGPASPGVAPEAPITKAMTAAKERRLMIMRNMMHGQRHGHGRGGYGGGYGGGGYGGGYGGPRGYGYGGPRGGGYGYGHRHHHHGGGW